MGQPLFDALDAGALVHDQQLRVLRRRAASGPATKSPETRKNSGMRIDASAVLAASLFHFGELSIGDVKDYLRSRGVEVR